MSSKGRAVQPAMQKDKICKLNKDGKLEEIARLSVKPIVFCSKCRAQADSPSSLCNPRALKVK